MLAIPHNISSLLSATDIKQSADTGGEADGDNVTKISRISHKGGCPEGKNRIYHTSAGRWEEGSGVSQGKYQIVCQTETFPIRYNIKQPPVHNYQYCHISYLSYHNIRVPLHSLLFRILHHKSQIHILLLVILL